MRIFVVGLGNWGTALANHLARDGRPVLGWAREHEIIESINSTHRNELYLSDVVLEPTLTATEDLNAAHEFDLIVLAVPSAALAAITPQLSLRSDAILVSVIKGLEMESRLTPLQYCRSKLSNPPKLAVLSGPSFARDIVLGKPCGVVAAADSEDIAHTVATTFATNNMRVYTSVDPLGVELGGILKNVIALAVGVSDGLQLGDSARAGLITRGLAEMMRLAEKMGANPQTLAGLSGLGDLAMTSTSDLSRNRQVGLRLGRGEKLADILSSLGSVAEGVRTAQIVKELAAQAKVEMPITCGVVRLLNNEITAAEGLRALISRPVRREF